MIIGAHAIIYSKDAAKDRAFFRDVLDFPNVDVGGGWLIFGLPPSEAAFHPGFTGKHEFYLMCEDVEAFAAAMAAAGVRCSPRKNLGWGVLTELTLPSGGRLGVYQPRHERPPARAVKKTDRPAPKKAGKAPPRKAATRPAKKAAAKKSAKKRSAKKTARRK
ncbi:MAG: extradiol dioxygenase [Parvularculaceae bacterium]